MTNLPPLVDAFGRSVNYLRVSVTDRCNLRCVYCAKENPHFTPHPNILRYEEIGALVGRFQDLGVEKVRLTGGEPLLRKGFVGFVETLLADHPTLDLRITTNATLLEPYVERLAAAGVTRINISLDSLDRATFARVTGADKLPEVLGAVDKCIEHGIRVKINAVAMRGVNSDQVPAFLEFIRNRPVDVRWIEMMPVGQEVKADYYFSGDEILTRATRIATLTPVERAAGTTNGPAKLYDLEGYEGRLGIITPISSHFCSTCNRLRITSDGRLRTCLFSDRTYRLRPLLRHNKLGIDRVIDVMRRAADQKPMGHKLLRHANAQDGNGVCTTRMASIGG